MALFLFLSYITSNFIISKKCRQFFCVYIYLTTSEITCEDSISGTDGKASETCKLKSTNATCTDSLCNNKTYTHPAFTFGNDEIKGFWIGKFELTGTISSITTKPNLSSIRSQTVSSFETNIINMKNSGNRYGLSTLTDTHMIKNSEWGAVAYLSHSKYGTCTSSSCTEIGINNNSNYITGCGATSGSSSSTTCNTYNTSNGVLASTTFNIYGAYDMNGGAHESVMANLISNDGTTMISGNTTSETSGYAGKLYNSGKYTSVTGLNYPNAKYYNKYSFSTDYTSRTNSKLGEAVKEVYNGSRGWYNDYSEFNYNVSPWSVRGGYYDINSGAGITCHRVYSGKADTSVSSRIILIP